MIRGMRTTSCPFLSLDIVTTDGKFLYQATQKKGALQYRCAKLFLKSKKRFDDLTTM